MSDLRYSEQHEWIRVEGETGTVGISDYAQQQLGDVVYVELPEVGRTVKKGEEVAVVESVKAASEVYAPVSGEITRVNEALNDEPALVNSAPTGDGWFFEIKVADSGEVDKLMDEAAYKKHLDSLG